MRRWLIHACAFLVSTTAIGVSMQYSVARESVRAIDLHQFYGNINAEFFNGQLPDVEIEWSNLTEQRGLTHWTAAGFIIEVDRGTNPNEAELRDTVQHESCHIATLPHLEHGDDTHGAAFQACMTRFNR